MNKPHSPCFYYTEKKTLYVKKIPLEKYANLHSGRAPKLYALCAVKIKLLSSLLLKKLFPSVSETLDDFYCTVKGKTTVGFI
jgi:hypothetical protein